MQINESRPTTGSLRISQDVIATIANYTTLEIEGVASLAPFTSNITTGWILKNRTSKPIVVDLTDEVANIHIHVNLQYGAKIPEVAANIQRAVKEAVQNMTGIAVAKVNVYIAGVVFTPAPAEE